MAMWQRSYSTFYRTPGEVQLSLNISVPSSAVSSTMLPTSTSEEAVFTSIENLGAITTSLPGIAATFGGTPVKSGSSRPTDSETRATLWRKTSFSRYTDCTFRNVVRFWDKFLNPERWRQKQESDAGGIDGSTQWRQMDGFPCHSR